MSTEERQGVFICLEGVDGAGKTTQMNLLAQALTDAGVEVVCTREPGGTEVAEQLRKILLQCTTEPLDGITELLLVSAARNQHLNQVIRPALAAGKWVICDRFLDTTYAYQVVGRGVDDVLFTVVSMAVAQDTAPDITFVFDVPDEVSLTRLQARTGEQNRLDQETADFKRTVNAVYREMVQLPNHVLIDGNQPIPAVLAEVLSYIDLPNRALKPLT